MLLLAILAATIIGALALVNYVDQRQAQMRALRAGLTRVRYQVEELEETLDCVESTLPEHQVAWHVNQEILHLLQKVLAQEPDNPAPVETSIGKAEERAQRLAAQQKPVQVRYARESDAKIAQAQHYLNKAAGVIRRRAARGELESDEQDTYLRELAWASLMVSVVSFVNQGHKAAARLDSLSAHAFFKKAQGMLMGSSHPNPARMRLIRELGELMSGRRTSLTIEEAADGDEVGSATAFTAQTKETPADPADSAEAETH